jgi:hypothetical protein
MCNRTDRSRCARSSLEFHLRCHFDVILGTVLGNADYKSV